MNDDRDPKAAEPHPIAAETGAAEQGGTEAEALVDPERRAALRRIATLAGTAPAMVVLLSPSESRAQNIPSGPGGCDPRFEICPPDSFP